MIVLSNTLLEIGEEIAKKTKHSEIILTEDEKNQHENAEKCHICKKTF